MIIRLFFLILLFLGPPAAAQGRIFRETNILPDAPAPVVGHNSATTTHPRESLMELACRTGVGFSNLVAANPNLDPWLPQPGREVLLPTSVILPPGTEPGITINLAEFRLYYVWEEKGLRMVRIYPIGVGSEGWDTPEGNFTIRRKIRRPVWNAPLSIRLAEPDRPSRIPPGPDNPLGDYWLGLSVNGYGIHGTNKPLGVGRGVSHGCIRLYPDDIRDLFRRVKIGTPVRIIYQPIKLGKEEEKLLLEVHADYLGKIDNPLEEVLHQKRALHWKGPISLSTLLRILREARGMPEPLFQQQ
jgi:L,D-transpeptidase ErfK/SrfK